MASTGSEIISNTVRFKHHVIAIPQLTPAERILEAARQLDSAIKHYPKKAPMDELVAIKLLIKVLLRERKEPPPPPNSIKVSKAKQNIPSTKEAPITLKTKTLSSTPIHHPIRKKEEAKKYRRKKYKMDVLHSYKQMKQHPSQT